MSRPIRAWRAVTTLQAPYDGPGSADLKAICHTFLLVDIHEISRPRRLTWIVVIFPIKDLKSCPQTHMVLIETEMESDVKANHCILEPSDVFEISEVSRELYFRRLVINGIVNKANTPISTATLNQTPR